MKQKLFVILTLVLAGCSIHAFSQPQIPFLSSEHSYLGVEVRDITASEVDNLQLPDESGVFIVRVEEDSPAADSDLREGDVVLEFGNFAVFSARQFQRLIAETPPGRQVEMVVSRDGRRTSKEVRLEESPSSNFTAAIRGIRLPRFHWPEGGGRWFGRESDRPRLGIRGETVTEQLGEVLGVPSKRGVLLMEVIKDSPAERAGLKAGDVIVSVDGHAVESVSDVSENLKTGSIELEIIRDKLKQSVTVELEGRRPRRESMRL